MLENEQGVIYHEGYEKLANLSEIIDFIEINNNNGLCLYNIPDVFDGNLIVDSLWGYGAIGSQCYSYFSSSASMLEKILILFRVYKEKSISQLQLINFDNDISLISDEQTLVITNTLIGDNFFAVLKKIHLII